uniref:Uncharacterized protein n=1 Tax=Romanomermis culicivorax TaxID=13658 RepID=A0A915HSA5_ROMCU
MQIDELDDQPHRHLHRNGAPQKDQKLLKNDRISLVSHKPAVISPLSVPTKQNGHFALINYTNSQLLFGNPNSSSHRLQSICTAILASCSQSTLKALLYFASWHRLVLAITIKLRLDKISSRRVCYNI